MEKDIVKMEKVLEEQSIANENIVPAAVQHAREDGEKQGGSGQLSSLLTVCPPYQTKLYYERVDVAISGGQYQGFYMYNGFALFNLQGKYSKLIFDVGHMDGTLMYDADLYIYLDGEIANTYLIRAEELMKTIDVPLHYANQLKIEVKPKHSSAGYGFANCKLQD